jgi:hypothetical protein
LKAAERSPGRPRIATILFHDVVETPADSGFQFPSSLAYKHDFTYFCRNIEVIEAQRARPASIFTLDLAAAGKHVLLTFDDGGSSAMRVADVLESKGWIGHFFITTNMIGQPHFLTAHEIRELSSRGHVIGSHSHTHPNIFYDLSDDEMRREWRTSCEALASILGAPIRTASIPGGDMDKRTVVAAGEAGIRCLFTSEPTLHYWTYQGVTCLGRVCAKRDTPLSTVAKWARFRGFARQMAVRRLKQSVKRLIAPWYRRRTRAALGIDGEP